MLKKFFLIGLIVLHALAAPVFAADKQADDTVENLETQKERISYSVGYFYYNAIRGQGYDIDYNAFLQGVKDCEAGGPALLNEQERKAALTQFKNEMQQMQAKKKKDLLEKNKAEGTAFLAENKKKEDVKTLESGLQYKILEKGDGKSPSPQDTIKCHYRGTTIDGKLFDSSYKRGEPATFKLDGVIEGWTEAIQLMKTGGKWKIFVPPELAYGDRGAGNAIEPGSTLIFEVELLSIEETAGS